MFNSPLILIVANGFMALALSLSSNLFAHDRHPSKFEIHGVTVDFINEMAALGYPDLSDRRLIAFKIHDVTADFIDRMAKMGFTNPSPQDLLACVFMTSLKNLLPK